MIAATAATACLLLGTTILSGASGLGFGAITLFHAILGDFVEAFFASVASLSFEAFALEFGAFHGLSLLAIHSGAVAVEVYLNRGICFLVERYTLLYINHTVGCHYLLGRALAGARVVGFLVLSQYGERAAECYGGY